MGQEDYFYHRLHDQTETPRQLDSKRAQSSSLKGQYVRYGQNFSLKL